MDTVSSRREVRHLVLRVAVPLWIERLEIMPDLARKINAVDWARVAVDLLTTRRGDLDCGPTVAAPAYRCLARGVAALALLPGGVVYDGLIWCRSHAVDGRVNRSWEAVCADCVTSHPDGLPKPTPLSPLDVLTDVYREFMYAAKQDVRSHP